MPQVHKTLAEFGDPRVRVLLVRWRFLMGVNFPSCIEDALLSEAGTDAVPAEDGLSGEVDLLYFC